MVCIFLFFLFFLVYKIVYIYVLIFWFLGVYKWNNDESYEGEWKNDSKHGVGTLIAKGEKYRGEWKDGNKDGRGEYFFKNGDFYEVLIYFLFFILKDKIGELGKRKEKRKRVVCMEERR